MCDDLAISPRDRLLSGGPCPAASASSYRTSLTLGCRHAESHSISRESAHTTGRPSTALPVLPAAATHTAPVRAAYSPSARRLTKPPSVMGQTAALTSAGSSASDGISKPCAEYMRFGASTEV